MAGPASTSSAKSAPLIKQGQTTDGANGSDPKYRGKVHPVREISPKS